MIHLLSFAYLNTRKKNWRFTCALIKPRACKTDARPFHCLISYPRVVITMV
jgi:hypothetical protein